MTPTECPPIVVTSHPMLAALERLCADTEKRPLVIAGIDKNATAAGRLTDIQQHGLMDDYDAGGRYKARGQLLGGLWGSEGTLLKISAAVRKAFDLSATENRPLRARWIAGVTAFEIVPIVEATDEAVYLILLGPSLKPPQVMEKLTYDPMLLEHLRKNAADVVAFLDSI
jgi:hypothetical protein